MSELLALPIMQPRMPTTRNILAAIEHFTDHLVVTCGRRNWKRASRCLQQLKGEDFRPLKKRVTKERAISAFRVSLRDAKRLESLPPMDLVQAACKDAMIDLHYIAEGVDATQRQRSFAANVIMLGLIYTNSYAGPDVCNQNQQQGCCAEFSHTILCFARMWGGVCV